VAGTVTTNAQSNITSVGVLSSLSVSGNIRSNSAISAAGNITTAGNLIASSNLILGNASRIVFGTTGGNIYLVNENPTSMLLNSTAVTVSGVMSVTGNVGAANALILGTVSAAGNITGNYFFGNGSQLTGLTFANAGAISVTGNVTGGNFRTAGLITATGNITGGNVATGNVKAGNISASGNVVQTTRTITTSGETGIQGQICWDSSYIYVCTATNNWTRVALSAF
jgi:hypothetical protein